MRIISILFIFFVFGSVQLQAQNSGFTAVNSSQCPGNLFTLSADDNSLATYSWTITEQGGGSSTYNVNPIAFVLTNPGLYDVSLTVSDGVTPSTTTEIGFLEVFDIPTIDYSVTAAPYCEPATVDFINNSTPGSGTIIGYQLFTDGTAYDTEDVQHTYATTGTYSVNVSIENSNGCSSSDYLADIVVSTNPALTSPINPNTICSGSAFNYTPTSSISGSTFSWVRLANSDISEAVSSGNGNISETLTNTSGSNTSVTYQVTNTSPTGCAVIENVIVTVQALPTVTINSLNVCTGSTGVLTATPSVGGGNYLWSTSEVSQSITVSAAGVYSVTYSVGSCASAPASVTVTETAPPVLTGISVSESSGLINDDGSICELDNVDLTALPSSGSGTYSWSNSASTSSISVSPSSTTTYSVTYTEGGCASAAVSQTIIVNSLPVPNYNATVTNGCVFSGSNPDITTDYTSTATGTISWQFPGGSPNTGSGNGPISVIYSAEGIYDATMTIVSSEDCETTTTFNNTIAVVDGSTPTSNFSITNTSPQCVDGNSFCFEYTGFNADTIAWDFGDGSPIEFADESSTVCHTFGSINTFTVSIIPYTTVGSILGCSGGGTSLDVTTLGPQAAFDVDPFDCDDQLNRSFTSTSIGTSATTLYTWDFGDPPSPTVTGVSSTSHLFSAYSPSNVVPYVVSLTVEDPATGCPVSTVTQDVYAFPNDQADFVMYTDASFTQATNEVCLNDILWFVNETPLPQNTNPSTNSVQTQWDWNLSNGIQWFGNSQYRGSPEDLDFSDSNPSSYTGGVTWTPGVYDVAMRNTSDNNGSFCYDTVIQTLTVHGIIGSFSLPDTVCIGDVFGLTDNSTAPITSIVQREWDWESDGVIDLSGNDPNPSHSFSAPGVYTVSLTCTDGFGCPQTFTEQIVVRSVVASFNVDRTFICDDEEVTVTANNSSSYGPLTYTWSAATNVTPNTSNASLPGTFLFNDEGNHTITLSVIDNLGCADNTITDIEVFDVVADGSGNPNIASCFNPPTVVTFTNSSSNNVDPNSIFWDFGNGETSTENSPTTIYTTAGSFPVSLTVESLTGGCTSTVVVETIEVAGPFGAIAVTSPVLDDCSCLDVDIDISTSDVAEATLLFGDGSFQNVSLNASETINHQYCNTGTTSQTFTPILYIASGTCNGNITANESVTIHPLPTVDNPGDFEYCEGDNSTAINFAGNIGSTTYNWTSTNTNTGINASGTGDIPSFITTNLQAASDEVSVITVTPVIDDTGCVGLPQDFSITVKKAPIVNAGVDDDICEIDNFTLNGSFGGGASSAQWSGGLGSYSPDDQDMSAVYTPSAGEIAAGSVVFTLTTDDPVGVCSTATDVLVLTINAGVIVNAGVDEEVCSNDVFTTSGTIGGSANSAEWSSSGLGTFTTATDLVTTYIPHPDDIVAGSVVLTLSTDDPPGPCFLGSDNMILSFSNAATISASAPTEICVGEPITLNAVMGGTGANPTWSNGSGSFSPNANNLNPIYTPTNTENSAGTVSLIITVDDPDGAGPCLDVSDQVDVALNDTVDVDAGIDITSCSGIDVPLNGSISGGLTTGVWSGGLGVYTPSSTDPNAVYTPTAAEFSAGTVTLTLTPDHPAGVCPSNTDDLLISFSSSATVSAGSDEVICEGDDVILNGSVGGSAVSATWSGSAGIFAPGNAALNPTFTPSLADIANGSVILTITSNDPAGPCAASTDQMEIIINPTPNLSSSLNFDACSVLPVDYPITSAVPSTFSWQAQSDQPNLTGESIVAQNSANIDDILINNSGVVQPINYLITATASGTGCISADQIVTVNVNLISSMSLPADQSVCMNDNTSDVLFSGSDPLLTFEWTNDNPSIGLPSIGAGDILSFTALNATAVNQIATITVTPLLDGCPGTPQVFIIEVYPNSTVDNPLDQIACDGVLTTNVVFTGSDPGITYTWTNNNASIGLANNGTGDILAFTAQNTSNNSVTATVTVTPSLNSCPGDAESFDIIVNPSPEMVVPVDQLLCEGELTDDVIFTGPNPTTSFIWTNDNTSIGLAANGTGDILAFTADNTSLIDQDATITVTPEFNGCLGNSQTFLIKVKPKPNAFATPVTQEYCSGQNSDEIFFSGDLAGTQYDWSSDNVSIGLSAFGIGDIPSFTVINSSSTIQTSTINVIPSFNGCDGDEITATIVVNPISTVVVSSGIEEYCHNDPTLDYIFNGSSGTSTYNWVNDNTSIGLPAAGTGDILSFTAINTDLVNQIATITVEPVLNGCIGVSQVFQILVKPIPTVDAVPNQNICATDDTDAILFEGTMNDTTAFGWTHDNVSIGLSSNGTGDIPSFVASNISQDIQEGNITVTPILNGCIGTAETVTITVNPISTVNAVSDTVCAGEIVPQIDFTGNNSSSVYTWVNDNNSIGLAQTGIGFIPAFVAENLGTTTQDAMIVITPSVNGCPGINDTIHIVVYPTPIVDPIGDLEYCAEQSSSLITFTGNMAINQYDWINDNAAIGLVGSGVGDINSYTTTNTGTTDLIGLVTVTPTANGCAGASEDFSIIVHPLPNVDAGLDTSLCFNQSITLTATGATSYAWDNGVINGLEFSPNSTITYNVIGTDANLCQNTDDVTVTYLLDIPPVVDAGPDQAICLTDDVILTAGGDAILYLWNNGVQDGIPFAPIATETYVVIGTAANGCLEADTVEVVVNPLPVITANASDDFICDGESTILWGEGANTYIWDQGVLDSVSFVPTATAIYTVISYDDNGCTDTTDIEVIVNPLPNVLFSTDMTYGGCIPFSPTFTDLTEGPESNEVLWVFGNGASSTQMGSVINTYDSYGCYNVTLISTTAEGCTDSLTQDDFVCVNPVMASFYPDVYEQSVINPIFEFTNESVNATSFEWFFGDGTESDFVNTTHFYDSYGVYNVALVAMAEDGCTDTAYVAITVNDEVLFYVPNSFTPNGDGKNEVFIPVLTAGYDRDQGYEFSVYNRWGEQIFFSETPGQGWDGTYNSAPAQNGTYIWYVKFKDSMNNYIYNHSGHFNLIN